MPALQRYLGIILAVYSKRRVTRQLSDSPIEGVSIFVLPRTKVNDAQDGSDKELEDTWIC